MANQLVGSSWNSVTVGEGVVNGGEERVSLLGAGNEETERRES